MKLHKAKMLVLLCNSYTISHIFTKENIMPNIINIIGCYVKEYKVKWVYALLKP